MNIVQGLIDVSPRHGPMVQPIGKGLMFSQAMLMPAPRPLRSPSPKASGSAENWGCSPVLEPECPLTLQRPESARGRGDRASISRVWPQAAE